jgi:Sulfotransferase domain
MIASDFIPPPRRTFSPWQRYLSFIPLYGLGLPLVRCLELMGKWPNAMGRRVGQTMGNFGSYQPTAHDVFVCSYFKSGTTWMLQMSIQIAHRGAAEFENIHHAVPWPDGPGRLKAHMIPLDDPSPVQRSPSGLRIIKTHRLQKDVPFAPEAKYIAIVRDPKDVCVSGYHFLRSLVWGPLTPSVQHWVDYFLSPDFQQGSWAEHLSGYWALRDRENVLFLTFDEMKRDGEGTVRRVSDFMGVDLDDAQFAEVVRRSGFDYMKEFDSQFSPGQIVPWGGSKGYLIRRGKSGSYAELLDDAQREQIDTHFSDELRRLGCDFPYGDVFH